MYLFLLKLWKKWWKHKKIWWLGGFCMWRCWSVPGTHCMSAEGPSWPRYSDPPFTSFGGLTNCDIRSSYHTTPLHLKKLKLASDTREAVLIDSFWWFLLNEEINVRIHHHFSTEKSQISLVSRIQLCCCYPWWPWKRTTDVHKRRNITILVQIQWDPFSDAQKFLYSEINSSCQVLIWTFILGWK